ncbi:hypothetical protein D9M69_675910 [compost metagenome]
MDRTSSQDVARQTVVIVRAVQQMAEVGLLHALGLAGIARLEMRGVDDVVIPVAGIDGHWRASVIVPGHPFAHAIALGLRIAFFQVRKSQHRRKAGQALERLVCRPHVSDEPVQRHLRIGKAAVAGRVVSD